MAIQKTAAIVLRSYDFSETSLVTSLYTKDFGKIHGIVKGLKRQRKQYFSYLQPFTYNDVVFYEKIHSELSTISQCDLRNFFPAIRQSLEKTAYASYFVELVDKATPLQAKNPDLFGLLLRALEFLGQLEPPRVSLMFEVKLLGLLGLTPSLTKCSSCGKIIRNEARFSCSLTGALCLGCAYKDEGATPLLEGTIASITHVNRTNYEQSFRLNPPKVVQENLEEVIGLFLTSYLENRPKSLEFLEKIRGYIP